MHSWHYSLDNLVAIYCNAMKQKELKIISQSPNNPSEGWDGTFNGQAAQSGVYVYQITLVLADGTKIQEAGDITLFR